MAPFPFSGADQAHLHLVQGRESHQGHLPGPQSTNRPRQPTTNLARPDDRSPARPLTREWQNERGSANHGGPLPFSGPFQVRSDRSSSFVLRVCVFFLFAGTTADPHQATDQTNSPILADPLASLTGQTGRTDQTRTDERPTSTDWAHTLARDPCATTSPFFSHHHLPSATSNPADRTTTSPVSSPGWLLARTAPPTQRSDPPAQNPT